MRVIRFVAATLLIGSWSPARAQSDDCSVGNAAVEKKNYSEALTRLDSCLSSNLTDSSRATMLQVRAQAYGGLKRYPQAVKDQEEALSLLKSSRDAWPWIGLAIYRRNMKQYDKALAALKQAEKRDEDGPGTGPGMAVYYHKGWTLHEAGRYPEAIKAFTLGISRQPDYGWALYRRALSYEALGNRKQAKRDLFRVAELNPKDGYEPHIVAKLKEYGFTAKTMER